MTTRPQLARAGVIGPGRIEETRRALNRGDEIPRETIAQLLDAADTLNEALDALGFDVLRRGDGGFSVHNGWLAGGGATIGEAFRDAAKAVSP